MPEDNVEMFEGVLIKKYEIRKAEVLITKCIQCDIEFVGPQTYLWGQIGSPLPKAKYCSAKCRRDHARKKKSM